MTKYVIKNSDTWGITTANYMQVGDFFQCFDEDAGEEGNPPNKHVYLTITSDPGENYIYALDLCTKRKEEIFTETSVTPLAIESVENNIVYFVPIPLNMCKPDIDEINRYFEQIKSSQNVMIEELEDFGKFAIIFTLNKDGRNRDLSKIDEYYNRILESDYLEISSESFRGKTSITFFIKWQP